MLVCAEFTGKNATRTQRPSPLGERYGGLDEGLSRFRGEKWAPVAGAAFFGSVAGSWVGGTVGPVAIGPSRLRRPVATSSLLGGAWGGVAAAGAGAVVGWLVWREDPRSALVLQLPLCVGAAVGVLTGLCAGRAVSPAEPGAAPDRGGR
jgi:hypothetical protein